ncbi:MAG: hypothetical protein R3A51_18905 [Nannocystaceae bacterium]|nr:hypothetical protein [Myxococcales bacterium]
MPDAVGRCARVAPRLAAVALVTPIVMAMHCPRRCPDLGPLFISMFAVTPEQAEQQLQRRDSKIQQFTIVGEQLIATEVRGDVVVTSCTPQVSWSQPLTSAAPLVVPRDVDCLAFTSASARWRVVGELRTSTRETYEGGRGQGVHGRICLGDNVLPGPGWEPR